MINLSDLIEVTLAESDDFLKVKETLTRMGIASNENKVLYQSCHILHKQGKFYIVHFKEMFLLDGKQSNFSDEDKARRNTIANLLYDWGLLGLVDVHKSADPVISSALIKIIPFKSKSEWTLITKYTLGRKRT